MNLDEFKASPAVQEQYREWIRNPMTQLVREIMLQEGRPRIMPFDAIRGEVALELHGESVGWFACLDQMIKLDDAIGIIEDLSSTFLPAEPEKKTPEESTKKQEK